MAHHRVQIRGDEGGQGELHPGSQWTVGPHELVRDGYQTADWTADDRRDLLTVGMGEYTQSGVIGRPSVGRRTRGRQCSPRWSAVLRACWKSCGEAPDMPRQTWLT